MKNAYPKKIFIVATILIFVAVSCNTREVRCDNMPEQIIGSGEIINNAIISDLNTIPKIDYIITSDSQNIFYAYNPLSESTIAANLTVSFDNGNTYHPIDFSKYTVLGKYSDISACRTVFDRSVTKNTEQQKYIYKIIVIHCGDCEALWSDMNWILIPKIEDGFSVEFVVEYERWARKT